MRETIKRLLREEGLKKNFIKDMLFKYWDKKGPSMKVGKYFSLSDSETADYLYEYYGDNVEDIVTEKVKSEIENYHSCGADNFNLRFDNISFTTKGYRHYNVTFSLDYYSDVFNDFDSEDFENLMTLYGQIEECVENMLNDKLYDTYGIPVLHSLLNGVYDPNI